MFTVTAADSIKRESRRRFLVPEQPAWWLQPLLQVGKLFVKTPEQVPEHIIRCFMLLYARSQYAQSCTLP